MRNDVNGGQAAFFNSYMPGKTTSYVPVAALNASSSVVSGVGFNWIAIGQ